MVKCAGAVRGDHLLETSRTGGLERTLSGVSSPGEHEHEGGATRRGISSDQSRLQARLDLKNLLLDLRTLRSSQTQWRKETLDSIAGLPRALEIVAHVLARNLLCSIEVLPSPPERGLYPIEIVTVGAHIS